MEYRPLGRTGVQVSPLCLGAMMFGPWGNDDRADSIRIIHRALDAGINFVDTADVYSGGVSEEIVGQALKGRRDDVVPRHEVLHADERRPQPARRIPPVDHARGRELPAPAEHRLHRPLPGPPAQPGHRRRGDPRRPHRPRPPGQGPLHRVVVVLRIARSSKPSGPPASATWSGSSPSSRRTRSWSAASRRTCSPRCSATAWAPSPTARSAAAGCRGAGARTQHPHPTSSARPSARFDMTSPANQRKLDVVEELAQLAEQAGLTPHRARDRVRDQPSRRHRGDRRTAHHGTAGVLPSGGRRHA